MAPSNNEIIVEQAKYEVLKKIGKTEIRRYPRLVIARVDGYATAVSTFFSVSSQVITDRIQCCNDRSGCFGANSHDCTSLV